MAEIVALGWGPLTRETRGLNLRDGIWREDGPLLPVELCHVTAQRILALALCRGAEPLRVLWSYMGTDAVGEAVWSLSQAEGSKPENVGFLDLATGEYWCRTVDEHLSAIDSWARAKNDAGERIDFIIWSDLKPNFEKKARRELNAENILAYLKGLRPELRSRARKYLENIPESIHTEVLDALRGRWSEI